LFGVWSSVSHGHVLGYIRAYVFVASPNDTLIFVRVDNQAEISTLTPATGGFVNFVVRCRLVTSSGVNISYCCIITDVIIVISNNYSNLFRQLQYGCRFTNSAYNFICPRDYGFPSKICVPLWWKLSEHGVAYWTSIHSRGHAALDVVGSN